MSRPPGHAYSRSWPTAQVKLVAAISALAALVLLASAWAAERGLRTRETARVERELEGQARLVRELLDGEPLVPERSAALQEIVVDAARTASLRITLFAADGSVLADSDTSLG